MRLVSSISHYLVRALFSGSNDTFSDTLGISSNLFASLPMV
ncbi:hypothetical protein [Psychromonas sp. SA13A]|nr:hypothetical protein [Psychromonas sp. SA13A]